MEKKEMSTYRKPVSNIWWLKRKPYILFMIRELTSIFVAGYCIFLMVLIFKLGEGSSSYSNFTTTLQSPTSVTLHIISLIFVLYHTITWFNLTPKILVLYRGEERISQRLVAGVFYITWATVSFIVAWLVLGL